MLFSSMTFLWIFLPLVMIFYFITSIIPAGSDNETINKKNSLLLFASLLFYAYGGPIYLFLMITVIVINYCGGFMVTPNRHGDKARKLSLVFLIIINFAILFFFKYFNMFSVFLENILYIARGGSKSEALASIVRLEGTGELGLMSIALPIGISFYIFQAVSYVVDVYRGDAKLQNNCYAFALYVSFFPQLIAGPIVQYADIADQITGRKETGDKLAGGIKRFAYGLSKKVIIANTMAEVADAIWALETDKIGAGLAWIGMFAYTFQIYFDFSGYSDMAIGLGRIFGFEFKENFNYPYISTSVREFWRRWHISLSSWFRDYVYIPLGGSRRGSFRTYRNLFLVFLLTGIWHGANLTFWCWGLMYAVLLIIERAFLGKLLDTNIGRKIGHIYTMFFVMIGWVMFRSDNLFEGFTFIGQLFSKRTGDYTVLSFISMKVIIVFVIAILFSGLVQTLFGRLYKRISGWKITCFVDMIVQMLLLVYSIMLIVSGTYNPFIYFQF